jgi:dephospho-CoA kinase
MKVVGLTGGIGTGKSTVAQMFESLGAVVIDADVLAKGYLAKGMPGYKEVIKKYGSDVLTNNLDIDRQKLAEIVFKKSDERRWLEQLIHPYVFEKIREEIALRKGEEGILIVDVPLLFETGADSWLRPVIVVSCSKEAQIEHIRNRTPDMSYEHIIDRLKAQMPVEEKQKKADFVIDNTSTLEHTRKQVEQIWRELLKNNV